MDRLPGARSAAIVAMAVVLMAGCDLLPIDLREQDFSIELPSAPDGATERCHPADATCVRQAVEIAAQIAANLGSPRTGKPGDDSGSEWVTVSRSPPFAYQSADGGSGLTSEIAIEIIALRRGGGASASIMVDGEWHSFGVDEDLWQALFEALYEQVS